MRKIVAAGFVSLDGVMQAPGGPEEDPTGGFKYGGWLVPLGDEGLGEFLSGMFDEPFDLLLGRKTYEIFAAHWPFMPEGEQIADVFNRVTKYVATREGVDLTWQNSVELCGDVPAKLAELKRTDGPMLLTQGSSVLLHTLLEHDLIDELRIMTFPVLLGKGKRFFGPNGAPASLKLVESKVSTNGIVMGIYRREGKVETGSFQLPDPSPAEIARRQKMKREG